MKRNVYAEVLLAGPVESRPKGRFLVQARLASDGDSTPYGRWSLAIEPLIECEPGTALPPEFPAFVAFVSDEAPHSALAESSLIELFLGTSHIGDARLVKRWIGEPPSDESFLLFEKDAA